MPDKCNAVKELKSQFGNALLVILTFAAIVAAFINFQQNFQETKRFHLPEDGVTWVDRTGSDGNNAVIALHVADESPAARNGIKEGDRLTGHRRHSDQGATDVAQVLVRLQPWFRAFYTVERQGYEFNPKLVIGERTADYSVSYQYLVGHCLPGDRPVRLLHAAATRPSRCTFCFCAW